MTTVSNSEIGIEDSLGKRGRFVFRGSLALRAVLAFAVLTAVIGCQSARLKEPVVQPNDRAEAVSLREGDTLKVTFPGAPSLNTTQQIRRDGKISLPLVGEVDAAGMTPGELQKQLLALYSSQLVTKELTVTVESSSFPVFVTGAVIRPGKILSNRPITALEAIMEAGGFDYTKAKLTAVTVIRHEQGGVKNCTLNLKLVLEGKQKTPFYLKPSDVVYVPEKFSWF